MKRCILYGVGAFKRRRWIENFLDEKEYEIIGYSDGIYCEDYIDKKRFYVPEELSNLEYDYIIINSMDNVDEIKKRLKGCGIRDSKMITLVLYDNLNLDDGYINYRIDEDMLKENKSTNNGVFVFGLSEAVKDIDPTKMEVCYMFAGSARDMYYNYNHYMYSVDHNLFRHEGAGRRKALYIMPYWTFGYDMSIDINQYKGHSMFPQGMLNGDYHNAHDIHNSLIDNAIINYDMFGRKLSNYFRWVRERPIVDSVISNKDTSNIRIDSRWNRRPAMKSQA